MSSDPVIIPIHSNSDVNEFGMIEFNGELIMPSVEGDKENPTVSANEIELGSLRYEGEVSQSTRCNCDAWLIQSS